MNTNYKLNTLQRDIDKVNCTRNNSCVKNIEKKKSLIFKVVCCCCETLLHILSKTKYIVKVCLYKVLLHNNLEKNI